MYNQIQNGVGVGSVGVGTPRQEAEIAYLELKAAGSPVSWEDIAKAWGLDPIGPAPDAGTYRSYKTGDSCSATHTIKTVQLATNNPNIDGAWGPESQKYLDASGMAYTDIVPGCTGPIPTAGGGGGGSEVITVTDTEQKDLYWGLPLWAWIAIGAGALAVGGTGAYFAFRKEDESDMGVSGSPLYEPRARKRGSKGMRRKVSRPRNSKGQFVSKKMKYRR